MDKYSLNWIFIVKISMLKSIQIFDNIIQRNLDKYQQKIKDRYYIYSSNCIISDYRFLPNDNKLGFVN